MQRNNLVYLLVSKLKSMNVQQLINLLIKAHDFVTNNKFANANKKGVILHKKKYSHWFAVSVCPPGQVGRSGHDGSQSVGPIWHFSGPEMVF